MGELRCLLSVLWGPWYLTQAARTEEGEDTREHGLTWTVESHFQMHTHILCVSVLLGKGSLNKGAQETSDDTRQHESNGTFARLTAREMLGGSQLPN